MCTKFNQYIYVDKFKPIALFGNESARVHISLSMEIENNPPVGQAEDNGNESADDFEVLHEYGIDEQYVIDDIPTILMESQHPFDSDSSLSPTDTFLWIHGDAKNIIAAKKEEPVVNANDEQSNVAEIAQAEEQNNEFFIDNCLSPVAERNAMKEEDTNNMHIDIIHQADDRNNENKEENSNVEDEEEEEGVEARDLRTALANLENKSKMLEEENNALRGLLEVTSAEMYDMRAALSASNLSVCDLQERLQAVQAQLTVKQREIEALQHVIFALQAQVDADEIDIIALKDRLKLELESKTDVVNNVTDDSSQQDTTVPSVSSTIQQPFFQCEGCQRRVASESKFLNHLQCCPNLY
ncbi:hypothetical protein T01_13312 [Trichinella spiralis]|uniref:Uncharacterized protein n=1 Tax=Trichinella spiralis TaxID=6334 RepID=A0A0V1B3D8_TRISP|nr:hypothetical protein T01_13312 [Trichinella spiralis]